ncbi:MAG: formylglycine-generating enzyme family protein [Treponema sp.]|nr:formylglycine-generating enzyme family protein [Treponema sp.]
MGKIGFKKIYVCLYGIIATLIISNCATTETNLLNNSSGYNHSIMTEANKQLMDVRPVWFGDNWIAWREVNQSNGEYQYFRGISTRSLDDLQRTNSTYWTEEDATNEAWADAMRQVSQYIRTEIRNEYSERIEEISVYEHTQQNGITQAELSQQQAQEESLLDFSANSSAMFHDLHEFDRFTETWEYIIIKNNIQSRLTVVRCWIVYRITTEGILGARERIRNEESLEAREIESFTAFSRQYMEIKRDLENINISSNGEIYNKRYNELLHTNAMLKTLRTLERRDDEIKINYIRVLNDIAVDIRNFNPIDNQNRVIEGLRTQIRERDAALNELRNERLVEIINSRQGYNLQTQTIIISFPQRPREIDISSVNILAASEMVTNMDFISFANINGINSLSRANQGLYSPVVSVTWNEAARYCNWLSRLYNLAPCYDETNGQITGYNKARNGFRLPEEQEIAAMMQAGNIINQNEFEQLGIWSSTGFPSSFMVFKLSSTGNNSTDQRLLYLIQNNDSSDNEIGFRVVRNAR